MGIACGHTRARSVAKHIILTDRSAAAWACCAAPQTRAGIANCLATAPQRRHATLEEPCQLKPQSPSFHTPPAVGPADATHDTERPDAHGSTLTLRPCAYYAYTFTGARRLQTIKSAYQHIEVWDTPLLGKLFVLDQRPMTSERDEYLYHESMVHPGALARKQPPRRVLVLGGGDGGAARQWLKYEALEHIVIAELDPAVVAMARRHLQRVHRGALDDPRVQIVTGDALHFVQHTQERFDAVVFDLTPPDSPASTLYTRSFYALLRTRMVDDAVLSIHLGSPLFQPGQVAALLGTLRAAFGHVALMQTYVPLYGSPWQMAVVSDTFDVGQLPAQQAVERAAQWGLSRLEYYDPSRHDTFFIERIPDRGTAPQ
ncbi:Spermidine synthase (EC 2.5.1.16) [Mycetohabitans rhizoxinica HKI 454]|uniref:Polyamine aminopropyltransferase n=1 Tax=Mycetohabitans rhizoxinica (strain DSM 19002 / CIP 109453 / HKI 454) TaxID=882378 RepID=E5AM30_MYCRK|nr:polyamine aminopropyltransferase [Mycetohabitans sp. B2]MCG1046203.1 polyamine aminopropyltransferase [Mycetohabitans sp. B6]CBW73907.1 Spermidine synthase (EC 2.5.1.16) [Mycetohabitans rhizoxinica HKI 454]